MLLDTPAKRTAERLLLLTESLRDALAHDRTEEFGGLFKSRQETIDQLGTMDVDSSARAMLERAKTSDAELMKQLQRTQATATRELIQMFAGSRNVQAYRSKSELASFQRTG